MLATVVLITILSMYLSGEAARRRGRSVRGWLWIAAIVGPFTLPVLWLLPARSDTVFSRA